MGIFGLTAFSFSWPIKLKEEMILTTFTILYCRQQLRRHGDVLQRTVGGYYIVQGRADDTMNLGGIKVIER